MNSMGQMHVRERVLQLHGNCEFGSEPGHGLGCPRSIYEIVCNHIGFRQSQPALLAAVSVLSNAPVIW
jgi:hypothetical protein